MELCCCVLRSLVALPRSKWTFFHCLPVRRLLPFITACYWNPPINAVVFRKRSSVLSACTILHPLRLFHRSGLCRILAMRNTSYLCVCERKRNEPLGLVLRG